jgi:hypothetical protein
MRVRAFLKLVTLPLLAAAIAGCGADADELPRRAVSGTITLDGQPLEAGMISFVPDGPGQQNPVTAGAVIRQGAYSIDADKGLTPGNYRVSIISEAKSTKPKDGRGPGPGELKAATKEPIPARYNTRTKLEAEVKIDGSTTFNYELTSK